MVMRMKLTTVICDDGGYDDDRVVLVVASVSVVFVGVGSWLLIVYDMSFVEESVVSRFNLVCDKEYIQTNLHTIFMVGILVGSAVGGILSDKIGRIRTMITGILTIVCSISLAGYSENILTYAILKIIYTVANPLLWYASHSFMMEIFGVNHRQNAVLISHIIGQFGGMLLVLVFYLIRNYFGTEIKFAKLITYGI